MAKLSRPRFGSLQFWPRKRAEKALHSVNWKQVELANKGKNGILGFISYKAGMASAIVKDATPNSMTFGKRIAVPVTILEVPAMKVFSVRFYKNGNVNREIVVSNEKELKKIVKVPKNIDVKKLDEVKDYDDVRIIAYSIVSQTSVKKTPDLIEVAIAGDNEKKLEYAKSLAGKEITINDFAKAELVDARGLTKGKGFSGAVRRFGISLKAHKSEKGRRRPGSLGPWHPARVTFRTPMAGQLGMFSRVNYNLKFISANSIAEKDINKKEGFKHYGKIKSNYFIVEGSVQGPVKRQILLTPSFRPTKHQAKKKYELVELKI